ncbi:MAG: hypothetical protein ACO39C_08840, partial [Chthoniobacterales bacterium]
MHDEVGGIDAVFVTAPDLSDLAFSGGKLNSFRNDRPNMMQSSRGNQGFSQFGTTSRGTGYGSGPSYGSNPDFGGMNSDFGIT